LELYPLDCAQRRPDQAAGQLTPTQLVESIPAQPFTKQKLNGLILIGFN
jgi:hypothetical protein